MPDRSKPPRLAKIAKRARTSEATVSRVLNNAPNVAAKMRERVLAAYEELYRSLPLTAESMVGLVVPTFSNPFFAEMAFAFERAFEERNIHLLMSSSEGKPDREGVLLRRFRSVSVRGIVLMGVGDPSNALLAAAPREPPVVVVDRRLHSKDVDFVTTDSRGATRMAIAHLAARGHTRIGYLRGDRRTRTGRARYAAFRTAMKGAGLKLLRHLVFDGDFFEESGVACAEALGRMLRKRRPTALLAGNDLMAIGLMQRLQEMGWMLPNDLSVVGFDDISWSRWTQPALTTIAQPVETMVKYAVELLTRRMDARVQGSPEPEPQVRVAMPGFTVRRSVASARQG